VKVGDKSNEAAGKVRKIQTRHAVGGGGVTCSRNYGKTGISKGKRRLKRKKEEGAKRPKLKLRNLGGWGKNEN